MLKAYRYRIYPNATQAQAFAAHFGCARWVYNWGLEKKTAHYKETKKTLSKRALQDALVVLKKSEDKQWLNEVNSQTLLAALANLDVAYRNFFQKRAKHPKFKSKYKGHQSYQCPQHVKVDFENELIHLPKIKSLKVKLHRSFEGKIKTCTIRKTPTDKYYISVLVENEAPIPIPTTIEEKQTVGIDLGIKALLITSHNETEPNHKFLYKKTRRIRRLQRQLSKKEKTSKNRVKAKKRLARLHEQVGYQRKDMIHQASAKLVYKSHDTCFAIEDLNVAGMMKNHKLAKAIGDCGWGNLIATLTYKAQWTGKTVLVIDRWAPSSKTCSHCGGYKKELTLADRTFRCTDCGIAIDRDYNAACNIKRFALAQIGMEQPDSKPADHALAGPTSCQLATHEMKQEAASIA